MEPNEQTVKATRKRVADKNKTANEAMTEHRKKYAIVSDGKGGVKQIER